MLDALDGVEVVISRIAATMTVFALIGNPFGLSRPPVWDEWYALGTATVYNRGSIKTCPTATE